MGTTSFDIGGNWGSITWPDDMMDVKLRVLSGYSMATIWAIMPPIEAPTICALLIFKAFKIAMTSPAMSFKE